MTKEKTIKPNRIGLKILILISLIAVIFCAVMISVSDNLIDFNWDAINPRILVEKLKFEKSQSKVGAFYLGELDVSQTAEYEGNLIVLTNYDIRLLNASGEEIWYYTHEVRHPVINVNGKWILIYEKNGKTFMVLKDGKVILEDKLDEEIAFGEITDKYILFIAISNNGYKRTISFIAPDTGINLGALYIDDYFPYYSEIFDNDKYFLLYGLGMNSTDISTIIRIYDSTRKTSPVANVEVEGLYPAVYSNNGNYIFAGEDRIFCYDNNLDLIWSDVFQDKIAAAGIFENNGAIVAFNGESKIIYFYNSAGEQIKAVETENSIQDIVVYKNTAAVICGSKVLFYDSSGKFIDNASLPGISLKVHFLNKDQAYLVSEHEVVLYNIAQ